MSYTLAAASVLAGSGNTVAMKRMANALPEHMFFVTVLATFVLVLVVPSLSYWTNTYAEHHPPRSSPPKAGAFFLAIGNKKLSSASTSFPKVKLAQIAAFDTLQMVFMLLGAAKTPGQLQSLLVKATIPLTLLVKTIWLGKPPTTRQTAGAACITAGAVISMLPRLLANNSEEDADAKSEGFNVFPLIFLLGCIPAAVGGVYKEVVLAGTDIDENYLNGWVCLFQSVLTVFCLPLHSLSILGDDAVAMDQLWPTMVEGFNCIVVREAGSSDAAGICESAWVYVAVWLAFMFVYNMLMTSLIQQSGAALMFAVGTLATPVTNLAFSLQAVMGEHAEPFSAANLVGLLFICGGIAVYKSSSSSSGASDAAAPSLDRAVAAAKKDDSTVAVDTDEEDFDAGEAARLQNETIPKALRFESPGRKANVSIFVEGKRKRRPPARLEAKS